jgi:hypothetical protein
MVYDADDRETFESLKMRGVDVYTLNDKPWEHIVTYAVKRIKPEILASYDISNTVESALTLYRHKPYFPNVNTTYSTDEFFKKWSDKNDMDSMYCSKLVYHTFKNHDINFDTNRTRVWGGYFSAPDYNYNGIYVSDAWIGVSPDDVYYSDALMNDLYIGGAESLDDVLSDSYF